MKTNNILWVVYMYLFIVSLIVLNINVLLTMVLLLVMFGMLLSHLIMLLNEKESKGDIE